MLTLLYDFPFKTDVPAALTMPPVWLIALAALALLAAVGGLILAWLAMKTDVARRSNHTLRRFQAAVVATLSSGLGLYSVVTYMLYHSVPVQGMGLSCAVLLATYLLMAGWVLAQVHNFSSRSPVL